MIPKYLEKLIKSVNKRLLQVHSQQGVMARNDLGFILWKNNEEKTMNYNLVRNKEKLCS